MESLSKDIKGKIARINLSNSSVTAYLSSEYYEYLRRQGVWR